MNVQLDNEKHVLAPGHRMCPGCAMPVAIRAILDSAGGPVITAHATGCAEICFGAYPFTAFRMPWIHSLFENAPTVISGIESLWKAKKKKGELKESQKNIKFVSFGGDGAVYDIGFQWLSGALERGHNAVFVCFDNEGFMNTGNQRSSSTPHYSSTSTSPGGKQQKRKPLTEIVAAHKIPYVAQCSAGNIFDLKKKAKRAFEVEGPAFLNILSSCPTNWKSDPAKSLDLLNIATETTFWPLFEIDNGNWKVNYKPENRKPIEEFLKEQKRFAHLFKPGNEDKIKQFQKEVDDNFAYILKMEKAFSAES